MKPTAHLEDGALHAWLDDELAPEDRHAADEHLASCESCSGRLERARALRERAGGLLGELEPGPVHAPDWEDLVARAGAPEGRRERRGSRATFPWAASVLLAFGLGWLLSSQLPSDRLTPAADEPVASVRSLGSPEGEATEDDVESEEVPTTVDSIAGADEKAEQQRSAVDPDRADDSAAERPSRPPPVAEPPPATVAAGDEVGAARREAQRFRIAGRAGTEAPAAPEELRAVSAEPQASVPTGGFLVDAGDGFVPADERTARLWLGAPLRRLSDLRQIGVEIGPAALWEAGEAGAVAVRILYEDAAGHRVTLTQQRLGERETVDGGLVSLVSPDGGRAVRWVDPAGYLLELASPTLSAEALRGLADAVR